MKSLFASLVALVLLFAANFTGPSEQASPTKYALVFAIGDYPDETGWGKISAANDVPLIVNALEKQGFAREHITVVKDSLATREGIEAAFQKHLLDRVQEGDIVFVHFSSHGQQIMDEDGDEIDGFDEAIVSYNAHLNYVPGEYEGEHHLRDDDLGELFAAVRKKLGPSGNLLALIDACHSGTATRGLAKARGTERKLAPAGYKPEIEQGASRGNARGQQAFMEAGGPEDTNLAPMVTISGASADELNYETEDDEGNGVGSLSYAFSKVILNATEKMTYRELFDRVKVEMQKRVPNQSPQIEGTVDQELFGGAFIESEPYFMPGYWEDEATFYVEAGTLQGLFDSSRVAVFDLGAQDLANADTLATGHVTDATLTESYVVLDQPLEVEMRDDIKVVVTGRNYASLVVKVQLDVSLGDEAASHLRDKLEQSGTAELVDTEPDLLVTNRGVSRGNAIEIYTGHDQKLETIDVASTSAEALNRLSGRIVEEVRNFARTRFLRTLEMEDSRREVSVQIVPLQGKVSRGRFQLEREMDLSEISDEAGNLVMEEGQVFKLRITNRGYREAYFTILDFTPDGKVSLVVPNPNSAMQPSDYIIAGGQTIDLEQLFIIQPPFGNEQFKLIATEAPLDLRPVIDPIRGTRSAGRDPGNPFQKLMENAASTTRAGALSMGSSSAHISTLSFKVKPSKSN